MTDACATTGSAKTIVGGAKAELPGVVELTPAAAAKLKEFMINENKVGNGLRIAVLPGGCSGYTTSLTFEAAPLSSDIVSEQHGVKVFVDKMSEPMLQGSRIDYVESLQGAGFAVNNPNAKGSCGCGASSNY